MIQRRDAKSQRDWVSAFKFNNLINHMTIGILTSKFIRNTNEGLDLFHYLIPKG
jgi:hypothetical protein